MTGGESRSEAQARSFGGRVPPHNLDAERSVLGAILLKNESIHHVVELGLDSRDFYLDSHQKIFETLHSLSSRGEPLDFVTLTNALRDRGWFESVGGTPTLVALTEDTFAIGNVAYYGAIVRDKALVRRMIDTCSEITADGFGNVESVEGYLDEAESKVFGVSDVKISKSFTKMQDILIQNMTKIEELSKRREDVTGVATGFRDFDRVTTGLHPGQIIIVAARPGMGKTSWFISALQNAAVRDKKVVGLFSLEMSKEELGFKFLSGMSKIDSRRLKIGRLQDRDWPRLAQAADELAKSKIFIDDSGAVTVMDIRARCRRLLSMEKSLDLVVVDYLQLMSGSKSSKRGENNREREIAEISRGLKELSKELKVPIIVLSQLNRSVESRQDKRPMLQDLRESGSIEQDADMVVFIHREDYYNKETENKGIAEIIIAKNRAGEPGTVRLGWQGEYTLFVNLAEDPSGAPVYPSRPQDKGDISL